MPSMVVRYALLMTLICLLGACNQFFDKDNTPAPTPLNEFTPEVIPHPLWSTYTGSGSENKHLNLTLAHDGSFIYTSSISGKVTAIDSISGRKAWQVKTGIDISTGIGAGNHLIVVASRNGDVVALNDSDGSPRFKLNVGGEMLASPASQNNLIVVKSLDGKVTALSPVNGSKLWSYQQIEPSLILRGSSAPLITDHAVLVGFANGTLAKLNLDGIPVWQQPIAIPEGAFTVQRMIDIDANPLLYHHSLFAATYQGQIASIDLQSGQKRWAHKLSSYTGMAADNNAVYISDAAGALWAFDATNGNIKWRQTQLAARGLTAPVLMDQYVVVGDAQGYLHWLNKENGHLAARVRLSPFAAAPIVSNGALYALLQTGKLVAYTLHV